MVLSTAVSWFSHRMLGQAFHGEELLPITVERDAHPVGIADHVVADVLPRGYPEIGALAGDHLEVKLKPREVFFLGLVGDIESPPLKAQTRREDVSLGKAIMATSAGIMPRPRAPAPPSARHNHGSGQEQGLPSFGSHTAGGASARGVVTSPLLCHILVARPGRRL